ncbi:M23 family metallopeptidase [Lactobacillus kefiranofaciens]|uniref:M23 family metallopeptidase n=1 Tax=Lactobacillus kefiranofaciens TaxID=267818 RepID=UPI002468B287|nr:M23 family metallopeptidase [Lactobacillus kefiranofaciens]MDH5099626.1 M23 family metallopeptidase [Lactobacillus kefiranofaciens]
MKLCKPIIALLSAVLVGSSLNMTSAVASADTIDEATTLITEKIKDNKWVYPFRACDKYGVRPMSNAQTFGMTDYLRSVNPPSYFHDGWDFGHSEVGYSPVYAIHAGKVKKVAYGSGLGWFIWVISPDKYVEIYQEGFNKKSDIYVKKGQKIKAGQKIGRLTGSHLHLGVTKTTKKYINKHGFPCNNWNVNNGTWLNPINVIKKHYKK